MTLEKAREILKLPEAVSDEILLKILGQTTVLVQIYLQAKEEEGIIQQ